MNSATESSPPPAGEQSRPGWVDVSELDVAETLAAAGRAMLDQHVAEVRALEVDLQFARLHSSDPRADRPRLPSGPRRGMTLAEWEAAGDKLVQVGGDGTPMVQELPICELAIARGVHVTAARNHLADALDLAHRLPVTWQGLREGRGHVWAVRRIAAMSRHLDRDRAVGVDLAVAEALDESPGRLLTIAEAAIVRADPEHERRREEERRRRRHVVLGRSDERGLRQVFGLVDAGDAAWLDAMIERVADVLADRPDLTEGRELGRDELRAEALGWLAHPDDVVALLTEQTPPPADDAAPVILPPPSNPSSNPGGKRPEVRQRAVLHVHLAEAALASSDTTGAAARVEELGPLLVEQVRRLLGHARVDLKGVVDLNQKRSVNGYEHPADVRERGFLRATGDVFPYAVGQSRRVDNDHPVPFDRDGPPGQTGDHNHAPLGRRHHRAKTHLPYRLRQPGLGEYAWQGPHGLCRLVDGTGTHEIDGPAAGRLLHPEAAAALDAVLERLEHDFVFRAPTA